MLSIRKEGLIIVKEFDPPEVYPPAVQKAREVLQRYNQTVAPENMLYATYKGSFDLDGRFTGSSIIHMRKADRRNLQIEGEEVFEADIKNCLPSLMYAQEIGEPCHGDAYEIHGVPRELAKTALVIMLNCYPESVKIHQ
jgi:hypothetical protein